MISDYNFKKFVFDSTPNDFFQWCLDNKLYKWNGGISFKSRIKMVYEGLIPFNGLCAIVAYKKNNPVGIILCEHQNILDKAKIHQSENNYIQLDWGLHRIGCVNIYIKGNHRFKGLASYMLKQIELLRLHIVSHEQVWHPQNIAVIEAREKAYELVHKYALYSYSSPHRHDSVSNKIIYENIIENIHKNINNDDFFIKPSINFNDIKNMDITYATEFKLRKIPTLKGKL